MESLINAVVFGEASWPEYGVLGLTLMASFGAITYLMKVMVPELLNRQDKTNQEMARQQGETLEWTRKKLSEVQANAETRIAQTCEEASERIYEAQARWVEETRQTRREFLEALQKQRADSLTTLARLESNGDKVAQQLVAGVSEIARSLAEINKRLDRIETRVGISGVADGRN